MAEYKNYVIVLDGQADELQLEIWLRRHNYKFLVKAVDPQPSPDAPKDGPVERFATMSPNRLWAEAVKLEHELNKARVEIAALREATQGLIEVCTKRDCPPVDMLRAVSAGRAALAAKGAA